MNIVGYRSPFKRKNSPFRADPLTMAQVGMAVAPGLISSIGSLFGASRRRREQKAANEEFKRRKQAFESIQYVNPYENLTNPYTNLQNPYAENLYEDLGVNMQSADFLREQQQQSQANLMQQLRGVAGGSGVAGLAQSMSNIASGQTQEDARTERMFGLSMDRKMAADRARQTARSQFIGGLGQAVGGIAGLYLPGGDRAGLFRQDVAGLFGGGGSGASNASLGQRSLIDSAALDPRLRGGSAVDNLTLGVDDSMFTTSPRPFDISSYTPNFTI